MRKHSSLGCTSWEFSFTKQFEVLRNFKRSIVLLWVTAVGPRNWTVYVWRMIHSTSKKLRPVHGRNHPILAYSPCRKNGRGNEVWYYTIIPCFLGMVGCFSMTQKSAIRDDPPGSPVCRRQSQKRNPSSRCPCSSTHPETKTPWKGHRTEMSGFRNGSIKRFRKVRLDDVGVFVFYVFDSYCTASCLSETSPWNSIRGAHGTLSCLQVPSSPCASAWLSRRCCTCLMAEMSEPRWTKPWPLVGLPVWKLMAGTHLNRFGATLTLLRIWVVEGLPVFEVPCQNMFKRRLEGSSSTRTIEKKKKTRRFPRNMDSKIWIYPETYG